MEGRRPSQLKVEAIMHINRAVGIGSLAAALIACGGQVRDVGSNAVDHMGEGGSTATGVSDSPSSPPPRPLPEWPSCEADGGAPAETWTGYVQGQTSLSLPNHGEFTLTLQRNGSEACGSIIFGEPVSFPAATDPRTAAPLPADQLTQLPRLPGFTYSLLDVSITADRLQFGVSAAEPYQSWCALQTSYPNDAEQSGFGCLPNLGFGTNGTSCALDAPGPAVSCDQVVLCLYTAGVCECNSERCMAGFHAAPGTDGDFHLMGDTAQGELAGQTAYIKRAITAP